MAKDLGLVSAYGAAKEGGYTGTFEEYKEKMLELLNLELENVGFSGDYNDLTNKPSIPNGEWILYKQTVKPTTSSPYGTPYFSNLPASILDDYDEIFLHLITAGFNAKEIVETSDLTNKGTTYDYTYRRRNVSVSRYIPTKLLKDELDNVKGKSGTDGYVILSEPFAFLESTTTLIDDVLHSAIVFGSGRGANAFYVSAGPATDYFNNGTFNLTLQYPDYIDCMVVLSPYRAGTYPADSTVKYTSFRHGNTPGYCYMYVR